LEKELQQRDREEKEEKKSHERDLRAVKNEEKRIHEEIIMQRRKDENYFIVDSDAPTNKDLEEDDFM